MTLEELVYRKYNERLALVKAAVYNGKPTTYHEYTDLVGYMRGMTEFMEDIGPYFKDPESAGDEEDGA